MTPELDMEKCKDPSWQLPLLSVVKPKLKPDKQANIRFEFISNHLNQNISEKIITIHTMKHYLIKATQLELVVGTMLLFTKYLQICPSVL